MFLFLQSLIKKGRGKWPGDALATTFNISLKKGATSNHAAAWTDKSDATFNDGFTGSYYNKALLIYSAVLFYLGKWLRTIKVSILKKRNE